MLEVAEFKKEVVNDLLREFPDCSCVKFWDDRDDNIHSIKSLEKRYKGRVKFELFFVGSEKEKLKAHQSEKNGALSLDELCFTYGLSANQLYLDSVKEGMYFIFNAWKDVLSIKNRIPMSSLMKPFGSYLIGRRGDVDLCLFSPIGFKVNDSLNNLASKLRDHGVTYIHLVTGIRCPRLKIRLEYLSAPPVDFDIVVACVLPEGKTEITDLDAAYKSCDKYSKISLEGLIFHANYVNAVLYTCDTHTLGRIVDVIVIFLRRRCLKGNAFHCIRTFHVVKLVCMFIKESCLAPLQSSEIFESNDKRQMPEFLSKLFKWLAKYSYDKWVSLFSDFCPELYIPVLQEAFKEASVILEENPVSHLFHTCGRSNEQCSVRVHFKSDDPVFEWKLGTFVEARLGSYVRKLITAGVGVQPGEITMNQFTFMIANSDRSRSICQEHMEALRKDVEKFSKQRKYILDVSI